MKITLDLTPREVDLLHDGSHRLEVGSAKPEEMRALGVKIRQQIREGDRKREEAAAAKAVLEAAPKCQDCSHVLEPDEIAIGVCMCCREGT